VTSGLSVLAVDDETPALDELVYLLRNSAMASHVRAVGSATDALHHLHHERYDVVLLDIAMPGIDGLELARVVAQFSHPPAIVFVTAHEEHALAAFDVGGSGYLLKPVTQGRLVTALRRVTLGRQDDHGHIEDAVLDTIPVEIGTLTRMVARDEVSWVESSGDYVRLHLRDGAQHLVRLPMSTLEEQWRDHGFARIHRSYLVSLRDIREVRISQGHTVVGVGTFDLPVSRRHSKELRDRLVRHARRASAS
jgi:DNA-binding LytR/AlgR family response regulator